MLSGWVKKKKESGYIGGETQRDGYNDASASESAALTIMVLEGERDIMILKGIQGRINSKTEVIVSKEWKVDEGSNEGTDLRDECVSRY